MALSSRELAMLVLQATVLLAASAFVVRGLMWLVRPSSPRVQRVAWFLVLVQGLILVRFPLNVPWYEPEVVATAAGEGPAAEDVSEAGVVVPPLSEPASEPTAVLPQPAAMPAPDVAWSPAAARSSEPSPDAVPSVPLWKTWSWAQAAIGVWIAGMVFLALRGILRYARFLRRISSAAAAEGAWVVQWRQLLAVRGIRRPIPLRVTADAGPALCLLPSGYEVLVPADVWRGLSVEQRGAILRHELAHYERGDLWKSLSVRLMALPHWFNPFVWWAVRNFEECTEWLCDDAAADTESLSVFDYTRALLRLGALRAPRTASLNGARGGRLFHRIRRLVAGRPPEDSRMKKTFVIVVALGLLLTGTMRIQLVAKEPAKVVSGAPAPSGAELSEGPEILTQAKSASAKPTAERAVASALDWLARHQNADGSWSLSDYRKQCKDQPCSGTSILEADAAATALGVLPFLGAGQTHKGKGPYEQTIRKGLEWLVQHQAADGDLSGGKSQVMYIHGIAAIALCEAYGMTRDAGLAEPARKALRFIEKAQHPKTGGWRYWPGMEGDTSVFGWQVMALKSGQLAGLEVNPETLRSAEKWLASVAKGKHRGLFCYQPYTAESPPMTAVGLRSLAYFGAKREDPAVLEAKQYLAANLPTDKAQRDVYYWFHATMAMQWFLDKDWDAWNRTLRKTLIEGQATEGCAKGSWDPSRPTLDRWGGQGGRLYTTSLAALSLEVYYRYLPLFKLDRPTGPAAAAEPLPERALTRLGTPRLRNRMAVQCVAISPDGATVASCGDDAIRLWRAATGELLHVLPATVRVQQFEGPSSVLAFSPDGKRLASGETDRYRVWDVQTGQPLLSIPAPAATSGAGWWNTAVTAVVFTPDGRRLVTAGKDGAARLWDLDDGKLIRAYSIDKERFACADVSADGKHLAVSSGDTVRVWDLPAGEKPRVIEQVYGQWKPDEETRLYHLGVLSLAFLPDGKSLATGGYRYGGFDVRGPDYRVVGSRDRGLVCVWDAESASLLRRFESQDKYLWDYAMCLSRDGRVLASSCEEGIRIWDAPAGKVLRTIPHLQLPGTYVRWHHRVALARDGKTLVTAAGDHVVRIWDTATGKSIPLSPDGHTAAVASAAWAPDGKRVATGGRDGVVQVWDAAGGSQVRRFMLDGDEVKTLAWSPSGKSLAAAGKKLTSWSLSTGKKEVEVAFAEQASADIAAIAYSRDGRLLAIAASEYNPELTGSRSDPSLPRRINNIIAVRDAATGRSLAELAGHESPIRAIAFSPDGKRLASVAEDGTLRFWDPTQGKQLSVLSIAKPGTPSYAAISPDLAVVALSNFGSETLIICDGVTGKEVRRIRALGSKGSHLAFSPDARILASASISLTGLLEYDTAIHLWDLATGKELLSLQPQRAAVASLAFSPDGRGLLSGMDDTTALIWDVEAALKALSR